MKELEEIYKEYSDNELSFMEKYGCITPKHTALELMKKAYNLAIDKCIETCNVKTSNLDGKQVILQYSYTDKQSLEKLKL